MGRGIGEDYIFKRMPSDERWYGNSETKGSNDKNWERENRETDKKEIGKLSVGVYDTRGINGTEVLRGR